MRKSCTLLFALFIVAANVAFGQTYTYTGTGHWTTAANWSPSYPGTNFTTTGITLSGTNSVLTIDASDNISITGSGNFTIPSGSTLINNGTLSINNIKLNLKGATTGGLQNNGTINHTGTSNSTANSLGVANESVVTNTGTINLLGGARADIALLNNTGTITGTSGTNIYFSLGGTMINSSTGVINNSAGGNILFSGGTHRNNGQVSSKTFSQFSSPFLTGTGLYSGGAITANGGISPGAATGETGILTFGNSLTGKLTIDISGAAGAGALGGHDNVLLKTGTYTATGALTLNFGSFTPNANQTYQIVSAPAYAGSFTSIGISPSTITATYSAGVVTITGAPSVPEINLQGNSTTIPDGNISISTSDFTDFESVNMGSSFSRIYTIQNTGTTTLTISSITVTGANNNEFVVSGTPTSIAASSSQNFTVTFTPTATGTRTATIHVNNDDGNESDYDFAVQGTGIPPAPAITSFTPTTASSGTTVTITGTNFTGATAVSFGGTAASSFTVVNSTTITAVAGSGTSGSVSVATFGGTATLPGFTHCVVTDITTGPVGNTYCLNATASAMTVSASGSYLTYQWYSNIANANSGGTFINGATSSSYTPPTDVAGTKYYYVVITGTCGTATSATLQLTINNSTSSEETQVACNSYNWNDSSYTASGDYVYHATNAAGCDSTATLHLTINNSTSSEETQVACNSYIWNDSSYTASGDYVYHATNTAGCDSTATLHLTIHNSTSSEETQVACNSYIWNDSSYTASGDYVYHATNAAGCDSTATLHLTINNSTSSEETQVACNSYIWNDSSYTASGDYVYHTTGAAGCDSLAVLHLTINKGTASDMYVSACSSYVWHGITYTTSGDKVFKTTNSAGCDSSITLHLIIGLTGTNTKTDATPYGSATGTITTTPSGGTAPYQYKLNSTGTYQTSSVFNNIPAGTYRIYLKDSKGCTGYTNVVVIAQPNPVFTSTVTKTDGCYNSVISSIKASVSGGVAPYQYKNGSLGTYQYDSVFRNLSAGTYRIYFKDAKGFTGYTETVTIKQSSTPVAAGFTKKDVTCNGGSTGYFIISASGGGAPYLYYNAATDNAYASGYVSGLGAGVYNVYVKDALGCTSPSVSITINQPVALSSTIAKTDVTAYGLNDGTITATVTGGTSPYQYKNGSAGTTYQQDSVLINMPVGTYRIYFKDGVGCTGYTNEIKITQPNPVFTAVASKNDPACKGSSTGTIKASVTGGTSPYEYKNGSAGTAYQTDSVFAGLAAGTYRIYFKDAKGFAGYTNALTLVNPATDCAPAITAGTGSLTAKKYISRINIAKETKENFKVVLSPNPSLTSFKVIAHGKADTPVHVRVIDVNGKVVYIAEGGNLQSFTFGGSFTSGVYLVEVRQGEEVKTVKAIKVR